MNRDLTIHTVLGREGGRERGMEGYREGWREGGRESLVTNERTLAVTQ